METLKTNEQILDLIQFRIQKAISREFIRSLKVDIREEELIQSFIYEIKFVLLGQHNYQKYEVRFDFPKGWFQHFKLKVFPHWLLEYYPVKYKAHYQKIQFDHMAFFPDWPIPKDKGEVIMFSQPPLGAPIHKVNG